MFDPNANEENCFMVIGYNTWDDETEQFGTILCIVNTIEEAEDTDDKYHKIFKYTEFIECLKEGNKYIYEGQGYQVGDRFALQ